MCDSLKIHGYMTVRMEVKTSNDIIARNVRIIGKKCFFIVINNYLKTINYYIFLKHVDKKHFTSLVYKSGLKVKIELQHFCQKLATKKGVVKQGPCTFRAKRYIGTLAYISL